MSITFSSMVPHERFRRICSYGMLFLWAASPTGMARAAEPIDALPETTLLALTWAGADSASGAVAATALGKTLAEPDVREFFTRTWREVEQKVILRGAQNQGGASAALAQPLLSMVKTLWDRPCALGLLDLQDGASGLEVNAALAVRLGQQLSRFKQDVDRIAGLARKGGAVPPTDVTVAADWTCLRLTPDAPLMAWTFRDDLFVLTIGRTAATQVIASLSGKSLGASAAYASAMNKGDAAPASAALGTAAPTALLSAYYNVAALQPALPALMQHIADGKSAITAGSAAHLALQAAVALLSVDGLTSVGASLQCRDGLLVCRANVQNQGARTGPLKLLEGRPITDADLAIVPRDATCVHVTNTTWLDALAGAAPTAPAALALLALEAQTGIKLRDDLLASLDDTCVLYDAPSNGGLFLSGAVLCLEAKNAARAAATIKSAVERLDKQTAGAYRLKTMRLSGREVSYIVNRTADALPIAPAWGIEGRWLVLALYPQMAAQAMTRMATSSASPSLVTNESFVAARRGMPAEVCAMQFVDTRAAVAGGYGLAIAAAAGMAGGIGDGLGLDIGLFPSVTSLTRHTAAAYGYTRTDASGASMVTIKPLPILTPSVAELAIGLPLAASIMLTMPVGNASKVDRAASLQRIKDLGMAVQRWSAANDERLPDHLEVLTAGMDDGTAWLTSPADKAPNVSYVLLSGFPVVSQISQPATRVLLYEKPELHANAGTCVMYADGHVQWRPIAAFRNDVESTRAYLATLSPPPASGKP